MTVSFVMHRVADQNTELRQAMRLEFYEQD